MRPTPAAAATSGAQPAARLHRWRRIKDKVARWAIAIGGVGVIWAVILIMFYLLWVVLPLFLAAEVEPLGDPRDVDAAAEVRYLAVDEQLRVGFRVDADGRARFVSLADGDEPQGATALDLGAPVTAVTPVASTDGRVLVLTDAGGLAVLEQTYVTDFSEGVENRRIVPAVSRPYGERLANLPLGGPVRALAASENEQGMAAAALGEDGRVHLAWGSKQQNFLSGETELDVSLR
ncbi:MAG: hypothetical protein R3233_08580, partial [Xanthomonadales bacterium]|nr:hypothetical protein [Xanthomonadales bacterium]